MPLELLTMQSDFVEALDRPATGAVSVYRNTVIRGAVEALRANFPVVEQIVGPDMFQSIAVDFAATCPPRTPVLALYGRELGDWLGHQDWTRDLPYLPDVARVERLRVECLFAADQDPVLKVSALTGEKVQLHPAARFAWLSTPAMTIWLAHQQPIAKDIAPEWKAEGALFVRPSPFVMHAPRIGRSAHRLLCGIRLGETVQAAMAAAARLYPEEDPAAVFASLANLGVFVTPNPERMKS